MRMREFRIALVNHADPTNAEHWETDVSIRLQRAIRKTQKMRKEGNRFAMLFERLEDWRLVPISLKPRSIGTQLHEQAQITIEEATRRGEAKRQAWLVSKRG